MNTAKQRKEELVIDLHNQSGWHHRLCKSQHTVCRTGSARRWYRKPGERCGSVRGRVLSPRRLGQAQNCVRNKCVVNEVGMSINCVLQMRWYTAKQNKTQRIFSYTYSSSLGISSAAFDPSAKLNHSARTIFKGTTSAVNIFTVAATLLATTCVACSTWVTMRPPVIFAQRLSLSFSAFSNRVVQ